MTAKLTSLFDPNLSLVYSAEGIELVDAAKRRDAPLDLHSVDGHQDPV